MQDFLSAFDEKAYKEWKIFLSDAQLSIKQAQQFQTYLINLIAWNKKINITTITEVPAIINDHFKDSLSIKKISYF